ncbi:hypothetical protein D3C86_2137170 [compost metagenome]
MAKVVLVFREKFEAFHAYLVVARSGFDIVPMFFKGFMRNLAEIVRYNMRCFALVDQPAFFKIE